VSFHIKPLAVRSRWRQAELLEGNDELFSATRDQSLAGLVVHEHPETENSVVSEVELLKYGSGRFDSGDAHGGVLLGSLTRRFSTNLKGPGGELNVPRFDLVCARVSAKQVALIPQCAECGEVWLPADRERWEAFLTDDEPPEVAFYCLECAEREFKTSS
jgi:hypothetical protein